ncbi:MAG: hypothetical protein SPJ32_02845 [Oscillospiraceae bacterium]|nr:hypothetical protein [Oscillospiraceae bacterium]
MTLSFSQARLRPAMGDGGPFWPKNTKNKGSAVHGLSQVQAVRRCLFYYTQFGTFCKPKSMNAAKKGLPAPACRAHRAGFEKISPYIVQGDFTAIFFSE